MITGSQIWAARALLDIMMKDLASVSGVNERTLRRYEGLDDMPPDRGGDLAKVITLEGMGVAFVIASKGSQGVILHKTDK